MGQTRFSGPVRSDNGFIGNLNTNFIDFNIEYVDGQKEGRFQWNTDDGVPEVGLSGGVVNLQIGLEQVFKIRNSTGLDQLNGVAVYISGSHASDTLEVNLARADDASTAFAAGLLTEDVDTGKFGFLNTFGKVRDCNTEGLTEGLLVWLSETVAGGYQQDRPVTGSGYAIALGYVVKAHATEGIIAHNTVIVPRMDRLSGVKVDDPEDGEALRFVTANDHYEFFTPLSADPYIVAELPATPVSLTARVTDGDSGLAWGATVINSGGGSTPYLVWYNGTNWTVVGK